MTVPLLARPLSFVLLLPWILQYFQNLCQIQLNLNALIFYTK